MSSVFVRFTAPSLLQRKLFLSTKVPLIAELPFVRVEPSSERCGALFQDNSGCLY